MKVTLECGCTLDFSDARVIELNLGGTNYCPRCGAPFTIPITRENLDALMGKDILSIPDRIQE